MSAIRSQTQGTITSLHAFSQFLGIRPNSLGLQRDGIYDAAELPERRKPGQVINPRKCLSEESQSALRTKER
jgi:hypothetical protein